MIKSPMNNASHRRESRLCCHRAQRGCRGKIIEGTFALDKLQMHQAAGGVVDEDEQGALWPPSLEPPVFRTVDLDQLAQAIAAIPRLMNRLQPGPAILP